MSATRRLLAEGGTPTVEEAAAAADISRTTAYRYFRTQRELLLAAYPEVDAPTLLPPDAPVDPRKRLDLVLAAHLRITVEWEPQLRASLRLSLCPARNSRRCAGGGRSAGSRTRSRRSPTPGRTSTGALWRSPSGPSPGIEPLVWLTDIAGLSTARACAVMTANAFAVFDAALAAPAP